MSDEKDLREKEQENDLAEDDSIEQGFAKMELLWKSRCVKMPTRSNVTVTEITRKQ
jgi:hypothetical protein